MLNNPKTYQNLRTHLLYLNSFLNPRVEPLEITENFIEAGYLHEQKDDTASKSLLDVYLK